MFTITNGYNESDFLNISPKKLKDFSIVYAGMLITPKMTLNPLFRSLTLLMEKYPSFKSWTFYYFGPNSEIVRKEVERFNLSRYAKILGPVTRQEVLAFCKSASLNVVVSANSDSPSEEDKGVIPGKIYELIGLDASILPILHEDSSAAKILQEVGIASYNPNDINGISNRIMEVMNGKKTNTVNKDIYSWNSLSIQFDTLLRSLIK